MFPGSRGASSSPRAAPGHQIRTSCSSVRRYSAARMRAAASSLARSSRPRILALLTAVRPLQELLDGLQALLDVELPVVQQG